MGGCYDKRTSENNTSVICCCMEAVTGVKSRVANWIVERKGCDYDKIFIMIFISSKHFSAD